MEESVNNTINIHVERRRLLWKINICCVIYIYIFFSIPHSPVDIFLHVYLHSYVRVSYFSEIRSPPPFHDGILRKEIVGGHIECCWKVIHVSYLPQFKTNFCSGIYNEFMECESLGKNSLGLIMCCQIRYIIMALPIFRGEIELYMQHFCFYGFKYAYAFVVAKVYFIYNILTHASSSSFLPSYLYFLNSCGVLTIYLLLLTFLPCIFIHCACFSRDLNCRRKRKGRKEKEKHKNRKWWKERKEIKKNGKG